MTTPAYLVGIDCGTQSAKVVIFDAHGTAISSGQQALRPMSRPAPGVVVHPDDDLWDAITGASCQAIAAFPHNPDHIVAIGLCPIRCCKTFLDANGSLIEPVISWMDDRAYQPYVPSTPELAYVTTASGYLAHKLTGRFTDSVANNIALQWPVDPATWKWSDDPNAYVELGVPKDRLVDLTLPGEVIGTLTPDAATAMGLPARVPVVSTANDKAVEMLGSGLIGPTTALISLGTYIAAMVPGHVNVADPQNFWTNFACIPHQYLYESNGVRRGMWTLSWFLDLLGPEVAAAAVNSGMSRESYLEREAVEVPAGSDGLMTVLDWLAPTDRPFRKGSILGFDARHTRGHMYRSILEAISLSMKFHVDAMCSELGIELTDIVISGGGANSELFMGIFADMFGLPAIRSTATAGASLGAAMCAAAGVGLYPSVESAAAHMAPGRQTFTPRTANTAIYQQIANGAYHHIRSATDPLFEQSFPLFH